MINVPERIKALCRKDNTRKNFRIHFPNGERADLVNEHIKSEEVTFTESLCSGEVQFGMCEGSILEATCDLKENLRGAEIEAQLEIDISSESADFINTYGQYSEDVPYPFYPITYGNFIIKSCPKSKNGLRKIEAYTQLIGDSQITAKGTVSWIDYGFSDFEKAKMDTPVAKCDYDLDIQTFLLSSIKGMGAPASAQEVQWTNDIDSGIHHSELNVFDANNNLVKTDRIEWHYRHCTIRNDNTNYHNLYYVEAPVIANVKEWVDECIRDFYGEEYKGSLDGRYRRPYPWFAGTSNGLYQVGFDSAGQDLRNSQKFTQGSMYFSPYIRVNATENRFFLSVIDFVYNHTITLYDGDRSKTYVHSPAEAPKLYLVRETASNLVFTVPRTSTYKVGKKIYYTLDYKDLFENGITVDKKDKEGNVTQATYTLSMRDIMEAYAELNASYGMYWRKDKAYSFLPIAMLESLYPSETLFPSDDDLHPKGSAIYIPKALIKDVEWEDSLTKPYGKVVCTCSPLDVGEETSYEIELLEDLEELNPDEYLTYDLSDNYIIKTLPESEEEILGHMNTIARALAGLRYMPASIEMQGLPFIEAGDWIEFDTVDGTMLTNALSQTIKGVQNLRTTIESE